MSRDLYEQFPYIVTDDIVIRKMADSDLDALFEICSNDNVYRYTPDFLHTQSKTKLKTAIKNLGERDFTKKRWIIAGICLPDAPNYVVGTAEMFEFNKDVNMVEIGYRINETYWGQGIASRAVHAMVEFLFDEIGVNRIQAFVLPKNVNSQKVLLKNSFTKEGLIRQAHNWKGKGIVDLELYSLLKSDVIV